MKQVLVWLIAFGAWLPARAHFDRPSAVLEYEQLIQEATSHQNPSELKVRDRLLKLTPLGSSPELVQHVIVDILHKPYNGYKKDFKTGRTLALDPIHPNDLFYVVGIIGLRYSETTSIWMTGTATDALWYFDDHNKLLNIVVWEHPQGP